MVDRWTNLFARWKQGDERARNELLGYAWKVLYPDLTRLCRGFGADEERAHDAVGNAWMKIIPKADHAVATGAFRWKGLNGFVSYLRRGLVFKCLDERRRIGRDAGRAALAEARALEDEDEGEILTALLASPAPSPEQLAIGAEARRVSGRAMRCYIRLLRVAREISARQQKAVELLQAMETYLHWRLLALLPDGLDQRTLTLEQVLARAPVEELEIDQGEMNRAVMRKMGLDPACEADRNTFDQRMKRARRVLRPLRILRAVLLPDNLLVTALLHSSVPRPPDALTLEALGGAVEQLAAAAEVCREIPALADLFKGMLEYARESLARTAPQDQAFPEPTLDQMLADLRNENVPVAGTEMYAFLVHSLAIDAAMLDQRVDWIRVVVA
jgi:DNA-directed RNA polymerase specialized sigma24 family protein